MGLVLLNRQLAGVLRGRGAVERAIANFQLDDILPLRLEGFGNSQHRERSFYVEVLRKLAESDGHS